MLYKIILSFLIAIFISACATTPKDAADSSGTGSSSESEGEGVLTETAGDFSNDLSIIPGSQEDLIVNVGDRVFFGYDSAELDGDAQELLQDQVAWLKQYPGVSLTVEGHCDERGTREYNLALGEKRAQSVKNYLISLGVNEFPYSKSEEYHSICWRLSISFGEYSMSKLILLFSHTSDVDPSVINESGKSIINSLLELSAIE